MKTGVHMQKAKRDAAALIAVDLARRLGATEAKREIAKGFGVSPTTARNLLVRGMFLTVNNMAAKAVSKRKGNAA